MDMIADAVGSVVSNPLYGDWVSMLLGTKHNDDKIPFFDEKIRPLAIEHGRILEKFLESHPRSNTLLAVNKVVKSIPLESNEIF